MHRQPVSSMRVGPGSRAVAASPGGFLPGSLGVLLGSAAGLNVSHARAFNDALLAFLRG
jgi:hypothetical protein